MIFLSSYNGPFQVMWQFFFLVWFTSSFYLKYLFYYIYQWKFAFLSLGRPTYLQDSDIVSSYFQVIKILLVLFFGNRHACQEDYLLSLASNTHVFYLFTVAYVFWACHNWILRVSSGFRELVFMVLGNSIWGWSTLIIHAKGTKGRMLQIRYMNPMILIRVLIQTRETSFSLSTMLTTNHNLRKSHINTYVMPLPSH